MDQYIRQIVEALHLQPHPEGGYYSETYRHADALSTSHGKRNLSTAIYYLLHENDKSHFHRLRSDELWFHHAGSPAEIVLLGDTGFEARLLGSNLALGETPQLLIPAGVWFAAHIPSKKGFTLMSCVVSPGFSFEDFEMATEADIRAKHPDSDAFMHFVKA